jgi:hypothetical protein
MNPNNLFQERDFLKILFLLVTIIGLCFRHNAFAQKKTDTKFFENNGISFTFGVHNNFYFQGQSLTDSSFNRIGHLKNLISPCNSDKNHFLLSAEPLIYIPYYLLWSNNEVYSKKTFYNNSWNFGAGGLFSAYFGFFKVSASICFNTKQYYRGNYSKSTLIDKFNYRDFVFQVTFNPFLKYSPYLGFTVKKPINYNNENNIHLQRELRDSLGLPDTQEQIVYDEDYPLGYYIILVENIPKIQLNQNSIHSLRIGCHYRASKKNQSNLNVNIFCDYIIEQKSKDIFISDREINLSSGRLMIGVGLSFEFFFNQH